MNLQQLETERKELHAQLDLRNNPMPIVAKLKENERKITALKTSQMLENVNREQARKREIARLVWECEQPTEDITCNDGTLHKVKARKYPKLAALSYPKIEFKDGRTTEIYTNGERFYMFRTKYEGYDKPTTYTRPETFEDFLKLNCIQQAEITSEQFAEFARKLDEANEELIKAVEKYDQQWAKLDTYQMQHIGLVSQNNKHVYIYEAKKGY